MKNTILLLSILSLLFISSCKEKFDVHADYKEVCQVIGILDYNSENNYLKITKAFRGNGNVGEMAKVADSSYFPYNELTAYLTDSKGRKIKLDTITITNKEEGYFYAPKQRLYHTKEKLEEDELYTLNVKTKTLNVKASVKTVKPVSINRLFYRPSKDKGIIKFSLKSKTPVIEIEATYYYRETDNKTQKTTVKSFSYEIASKRFDNVGAESDIIIECDPTQFWQELKNNVKWNPSVTRRSGYRDKENKLIEIEIKTTVFDENIYYYYLSAQGDDGLVQDRPTYSNIKNGEGILGAKTSRSDRKRFLSNTLDILRSLNLQFVDDEKN